VLTRWRALPCRDKEGFYCKKGGMGEVWRARDTKLGREVAIKTPPEEFAGDADRLARFEREACRANVRLSSRGQGSENGDYVRF